MNKGICHSFHVNQNLPIKTCPKQEFFEEKFFFEVNEKIRKKVTERKYIFSYGYFCLDALIWIAAIFVAVFCLTITTYFVVYRKKILVMSFSYASRNRSNECLLIFPEYLF